MRSRVRGGAVVGAAALVGATLVGAPAHAGVGAAAGFAEDMLSAHNTHRACHQVPPLAMSAKLTTEAVKRAERLAKLGRLQHSGGYGENLYWSSRSVPTGAAVTNAWYAEIKNVDWDKPVSLGGRAAIGHFTQIVWKSSTELGVGTAPDRNGKGMYVVALYAPQGNVISTEKDNVLPPAKPCAQS